jgi:hypothetical protein
MATPVHLEESRDFPVSVEDAFDVVLPAPLPGIFNRRYAALPAVKEVRDQAGEWGTVGQTRTIVLGDGGTMRETLTSLERPHSFGYTISEVTGPMKLLAHSLDGRWSFEPVGTGVRITWAWELRPANVVGRLAMPLFTRSWHGYARRAMEEIGRILVP